MRSLNRNATVDTTALCKTFSGNGEESWCEAARPTTGCLYIYPEESAIELRLFSGCDPHVDDIITFVLRDKDVREMLARYYQKGRKDRYSMRWRCGMSGCEDIYINFVDGHGLVMSGKHLVHVTTSWPASVVCTSEILPNVHTNWRSMGITLITEHRSAIQSRTLPKAQVRRCTGCNVQPNPMGLLRKSEEAHFLCKNSNSMIFVTKKCYPQKNMLFLDVGAYNTTMS